jgi:hypothetical protein
MVLAMSEPDFLQQRRQPLKFVTCEDVVFFDDDVYQANERQRLGTRRFRFDASLFGLLQELQHFLRIESLLSASVCEWLVAPAAVVDFQFLEYASRTRILDRKLTYSFRGIHQHKIFLPKKSETLSRTLPEQLEGQNDHGSITLET